MLTCFWTDIRRCPVLSWHWSLDFDCIYTQIKGETDHWKMVNRNSDKTPLKSMEKSHAECVALATWQPLALIQSFIDLYPTYVVSVYLKSYSTGWSEWHRDWRTHSDLIKWSIRQVCVLPNSSVIVGLCLVLFWRIEVWISVAGNW